MVAKFVLEVEPGEGFEPARVLYTGTTRKYLDRVYRAFSAFTHGSSEDVHLSQLPLIAMGYAADRAEFYGDSPVVLVVDTEKLEGELRYRGEYTAKALTDGSFIPHELSLDEEGRVSTFDCNRLEEIADQIEQVSSDKVKRMLSRFLSGGR